MEINMRALSYLNNNTLRLDKEKCIGCGRCYVSCYDGAHQALSWNTEHRRVSLIKENCVIDPMSFKRTTENNVMIADYLDKKYGEIWRKELPTKPFGIK